MPHLLCTGLLYWRADAGYLLEPREHLAASHATTNGNKPPKMVGISGKGIYLFG
jgi:hypothetical protein